MIHEIDFRNKTFHAFLPDCFNDHKCYTAIIVAMRSCTSPLPINLYLCFSQTSVGHSSPPPPSSGCKLKHLADKGTGNEFPWVVHVLLMGVDDLDAPRFPSSINCCHSAPPAAKSVTWPCYANTPRTIKARGVGVSLSVHVEMEAWRRVNPTLQGGKSRW